MKKSSNYTFIDRIKYYIQKYMPKKKIFSNEAGRYYTSNSYPRCYDYRYDVDKISTLLPNVKIKYVTYFDKYPKIFFNMDLLNSEMNSTEIESVISNYFDRKRKILYAKLYAGNGLYNCRLELDGDKFVLFCNEVKIVFDSYAKAENYLISTFEDYV